MHPYSRQLSLNEKLRIEFLVEDYSRLDGEGSHAEAELFLEYGLPPFQAKELLQAFD